MRSILNFSAGPAMLPEEVLQKIQAELLDWHGTGMSIMELGHRGLEFKEVAEQAEADLRELMQIPSNYQVLFVPGGATAQFAMVPLNLLGRSKRADYVDTGIWSKKAIDEAKRYGEINIAARITYQDDLIHIPKQSNWKLNDNAAYLHYTPNETIEGIEFHWVPKTGQVPLVADMSSMILSRPVDVSQYGVIYAGAQKNLGQAGVTIVIVRDDLIGEPLSTTPTLYQYKTHAEHHSFYNTPPTFSWYVTGLVLQWMKQKGGVDVFYKMNQRKAQKLYQLIDHSDFYSNSVHPDCRSQMNVVFTLHDNQLEKVFLAESAEAGLANLRGHRVVGGMRASIYNAMSEADVNRLIDFMTDFAKRHG